MSTAVSRVSPGDGYQHTARHALSECQLAEHFALSAA